MKRSVKLLSVFLGVSMFMFGMLKFIDPFRSWYLVQVTASNLPVQSVTYWSGQLGEIISGIVFLLLVLLFNNLTGKAFGTVFLLNNSLVVIMMIVAFYVHLHPQVPHDVLPLKIKPPFIPALFLTLSVLNVFLQRGNPLEHHADGFRG